MAAAWHLENVEFIEQQPKARVPLFYAACDLGLVTLRDTPLFQEVLPSKIFEYLGMQRPVLLNVAGEARQLVERAGAGEFLPPDDPGAMADAVLRLSAHSDQLDQMGRAGHDYVLKHFNRRDLAKQYLKILERVASPKGASVEMQSQ
jgi:glycosyltransferase involved in cell wall biosynthesis